MIYHPSLCKICRYALIFMLGFLIADSASGQSLIERLLWERTQAIASDSGSSSEVKVIPLPTDPLGVRTDTIRQWLMSLAQAKLNVEPDDTGGIVISSWKTVRMSEIPDYQALFDTTKWAFLGSSSLSALDTTQTRELRARLEYRFGEPTRTLAEMGQPSELSRAEMIEFEYWFVLNDTIPVVIIDVNGPWDRGLVMASSHLFRERLAELKEAFLGQLVGLEDRKAYADYYYNPAQQLWYVSGFDGASFFDVRIGRPNLELGRPILEEYTSGLSRSQE